MRKLLPLLSAVVLSVVLIGCAQSQEDSIVKDFQDLNERTAAAIDKAKDMAAYRQAKKKYGEDLQGIIKKLRDLPKDKLKEFLSGLEKKIEKSDLQLESSTSKFVERMKKGPNPVVLMTTSKGPIKIELYEKLAPITVKNFLTYVDEKYYDGLIFHRVIPTFMVQGGGFEPGMKREKPTHAPIENEAYNGLQNERGTLAMARTDDPDSATAQFFINVVKNPNLNRRGSSAGYAVFGKVIEGMDVVDTIRDVKTHDFKGHKDVPQEDVLIRSARRAGFTKDQQETKQDAKKQD